MDNLEQFSKLREELLAEARSIDEQIAALNERKQAIFAALGSPKGYVGRTGTSAGPDPEFVAEVVRRRSALKLSAIALSKACGLSGGYMSMLENGTRHASSEAKAAILSTLSQLEESTS